MSFMNKVRKFERIRFYVSLLLIGVLFFAVACIVLSKPKKELSSTEGVIQRIETHYDVMNETTMGEAYISYTDADGTLHENVRTRGK